MGSEDYLPWRHFYFDGSKMLPLDETGWPKPETQKPVDWTKIGAYRKDLEG